jgi:hypothetical protein
MLKMRPIPLALAVAAGMCLIVDPAMAQAAGDLGQVGQNIARTMGGATGAYLAAAAFIVCLILAGCHVMSPRSGIVVVSCFVLAWCGPWVWKTVIGWM